VASRHRDTFVEQLGIAHPTWRRFALPDGRKFTPLADSRSPLSRVERRLLMQHNAHITVAAIADIDHAQRVLGARGR